MPSTPQQIRRRDQVEAALRLAAPFLDLLLAAGDRVSRIVAPAEDESYVIRPAGERLELGDLRPRAGKPTPHIAAED
jgi:hypothetical protein